MKFIQFKQSYNCSLIELEHRFLWWTWRKWYHIIPFRVDPVKGRTMAFYGVWVKLPEFCKTSKRVHKFLDKYFSISLDKGLTDWKNLS